MSISPAVFLAFLQNALDRLDELAASDASSDCTELVRQAGKLAARLGHHQLYLSSLALVGEIQTSEQTPKVNVLQAYEFFTGCVRDLDDRYSIFPRDAVHQGLTVKSKQRPRRRFQAALEAYRAAEEAMGSGVGKSCAYMWARDSGHFNSQLPPSFNSFERYLREALRIARGSSNHDACERRA